MAADTVNKIRDLKSEIQILAQKVQELVLEMYEEVPSLTNDQKPGGPQMAVPTGDAASKVTADRDTDEEEEGGGGLAMFYGS